MKKIIFFLLISTTVFAQNVDYNKIILPSGVQTDDFAEKLVQIAWRNHPTNEIFRREVNIADIEVNKSKVQWLDLVRFSSNLNEFVLNPGADQLSRSAFYPKYNVNGSISIATFFTIPYNTKQSKERLMITQAQVNAQKLQVRNSVMRAYNNYVLREKIFRIQSQLALDNETSHKLLEQKFKNGEITFETYSASLGAFSQMTLNQLTAERDYKDAKLDLEQLIGMKLEDVR
ncbi:TolC family protein [Chryseosolibacter indicus]|uniref:TolC family protein n=1 Tax=Chryseosolibacter indicus TaxID=2782351 RepID=A0ABS5VMI6_9BACT|nr:TolC family protein [Chryseosolibacter indicus]MBT1702591.1 TolC family protein [Chryseosolibacter indicus]